MRHASLVPQLQLAITMLEGEAQDRSTICIGVETAELRDLQAMAGPLFVPTALHPVRVENSDLGPTTLTAVGGFDDVAVVKFEDDSAGGGFAFFPADGSSGLIGLCYWDHARGRYVSHTTLVGDLVVDHPLAPFE